MYIVWLIICYLSFVSIGASASIVSSIWPTIATTINVLETNLGIFMGVFLAFNVIFLSLASKIIEKLGTRVTISLGVALIGLGILIMSFAVNFPICILAAIILGTGGGITDTTSDYYVAKHYKARHLSWLHCFWSLGSTLIPIVLIKLFSLGLTYRNAYFVIAPVYLVFALFIFLIKIVDDKKRIDKISNSENVKDEKTKVDYKKIFSTKKSFAFFSMMFFADFLMTSASTWISTYLIVIYNVDAKVAAGMVSIYFVGVSITRFLCGLAAEKFGHIKIMSITVLTYIIASILMIVINGNMMIMPILVFLLGVGAAPQYPLCISYSKQIFSSDQLNGVIGFAGSAAQFGSWVSSVLIGFLGGIFTLNVFVYVILVASILGLIILRRLAR